MESQGIAAQILNQDQSAKQPPTVTGTESGPEKESQSGNQLSDFESRFGVLTKMERKIKEAEAKLKEQERGWDEKGKKLSEYEEEMKLFDANPLEFLKKKKGWGVQEFNEYVVKHAPEEDLDPVAQITKNFQTKMDEMNKAWEEKLNSKIKEKEDEINANNYDRQIVEFKHGIKNFLTEHKGTYEFIHAEEGGSDAVYDLIYQDILRQQKSGVPDSELKVMDVKDAAEKVETFLDTQYSKYLNLSKVKSKFQTSGGINLGSLAAKSQPKTLDSSFSPKSKSIDQLSPEERRQNAIAFLRSSKT
jgi:peroxiredoxin family protein